MTSTSPRLETLKAAIAASPTSINAENRTCTVRFFSGQPIQRVTWTGEPFALQFDPAGCDLTRLQSGAAPVLDSHSQTPIASQVGVVLKAWRSGVEFFAELRISDRPEVEGLWRDIAGGIVRGISMGAEIHEYEDVEENGRLIRRDVTKWLPLELSFVSVPADHMAVTLGHEACGPESRTRMETTHTGAPAPITTNPERERCAEITRIGAAAGMPLDTIQNAIAGGSTVEQFKDITLARMVELSNRNDTQVGAQAPTIQRDQADTRRDGMIEALCARAAGRAPAEIGRPWHGMRLLDLGRECLAQRGIRATGGDSRALELAMHSTTDFPNLLSGYASKTLLAMFEQLASPLKRIANRTTASDFKSKYTLRVGTFPALLQIPEGSYYTYGTTQEQVQSYALKTFGRAIAFTRQAIINDDLDAFGIMLRQAALAAASVEASLLVDMLYGAAGVGPTLSDTFALFHANHGNLAGAGAVISDTTLSAGRLAMRTQKGLDNATIIDCNPKFLLVPAALQTTAEKYLATIAAATSATVNPFSNSLELLVDPRLDAKSATRWYLAADPQAVPTLEYAYLAAEEGPHVESRVGWETDGVEVKVRLDFGTGAIDFRGMYSNPGA